MGESQFGIHDEWGGSSAAEHRLDGAGELAVGRNPGRRVVELAPEVGGSELGGEERPERSKSTAVCGGGDKSSAEEWSSAVGKAGVLAGAPFMEENPPELHTACRYPPLDPPEPRPTEAEQAAAELLGGGCAPFLGIFSD